MIIRIALVLFTIDITIGSDNKLSGVLGLYFSRSKLVRQLWMKYVKRGSKDTTKDKNCFGQFNREQPDCISCDIAVECYESTQGGMKMEEEGFCDDCNEKMEYVKDNIWYCQHCDMFLEWNSIGHFYTLSEIDGSPCKIKGCTLNVNGRCGFIENCSVVNILNCPKGYGK